MFTIDHTIEISAPVSLVYSAISTEAGYRAWFAQDADFDGKLATFRFAQPTETRSVTLQIERCDERGVMMTCVAHENNPDWVGTTLTIEVSEAPGGARVRLIHAGYREKNEVYERCNDAWQYFLRSLASFALTGTGEPYPKAA